MKSLMFFGALLCCLAVGQYGYSDACCAPQQSAPADAPCEEQLNDCYSLFVHYEPCYYTTQRCVETQVPCTKKCYRKVPKYYEVQRCKMVPQYYTETKCKYETECYEVADTKCCKEYVTDNHVKYVPKYYWKHTCDQNAPATPSYAGDNSGCCVQ